MKAEQERQSKEADLENSPGHRAGECLWEVAGKHTSEGPLKLETDKDLSLVVPLLKGDKESRKHLYLSQLGEKSKTQRKVVMQEANWYELEQGYSQ